MTTTLDLILEQTTEAQLLFCTGGVGPGFKSPTQGSHPPVPPFCLHTLINPWVGGQNGWLA
jgi:hypothetical protein